MSSDELKLTARRAALYVRVSTEEQTTDNQLPELLRLAQARGFEPVVYEETGSAVKVRPVFERMLADARAGRVQVVVVWALDRLHRSMQATINTLLELDRINVQVISLREFWFDTSGPIRGLLTAIMGWVGEAGAEQAHRAHQGGPGACAPAREEARASHHPVKEPGGADRRRRPGVRGYVDPQGRSPVGHRSHHSARLPQERARKRPPRGRGATSPEHGHFCHSARLRENRPRFSRTAKEVPA